MSSLAGRNRVTALIAAGVVVAMTGLAFAAVPLYRVFCQVFQGTIGFILTPLGYVEIHLVTIRIIAF